MESKLDIIGKKVENNKNININKFILKDNIIDINSKEEYNNSLLINSEIINFNNSQDNNNIDLNKTLTENDSDIEDKDKIINLFYKESKKKFKGRWSEKEKILFLEGFYQYKNNWKKLNEIIKSRSIIQLRSHAQKVLIKLKKFIKTFQNVNFVKNKISEFFQQELNEKYNPIYLNKFTLYIINLFSSKKIKRRNNFSFDKLNNLNLNKNDYNKNLNNNQLKFYDNFKKENKEINKKGSFYINKLTVNYINSLNNNKIENNNQISQNLNKSHSQSSINFSEEFYQHNEHNTFDETFYQRFNLNEAENCEKNDENNNFFDN